VTCDLEIYVGEYLTDKLPFEEHDAKKKWALKN
jgi:hypothetical protein